MSRTVDDKEKEGDGFARLVAAAPLRARSKDDEWTLVGDGRANKAQGGKEGSQAGGARPSHPLSRCKGHTNKRNSQIAHKSSHERDERIRLLEEVAPWQLDPEAERTAVSERVAARLPMGLLASAPYYSRCVRVGVKSV